MKIGYILFAGMLLSGCASSVDTELTPNPTTESGIVKIEWHEPKKYRDIKAVGEAQSRYEQRVFDTLTKNLNKTAENTLAPNQSLQMVVTDLDLAGDVRPTFGATSHDIRVIKDIYPPRITFSYQVKEGDKILIEGEENLTDLSYRYTVGKRDTKALTFETKLLNDWLQKSIQPQL